MKTKFRSLASVLFLLAVALCVIGLTSCNVSTSCSHEWGDWSTTKAPTCTEDGMQERQCQKCEQTETALLEATGHDWSDATCTAPKTCKTCSVTEGTAADHVDAADDTDHVCDFGCGTVVESCSDADTDTDHACDVCGTVLSECADADTDTDHACDVCGTVLGTCSDAEGDGNHACDICGAADVSSHNYGDATCGSAATCSECGATTGSPAEHIYNQEVVKTETLKSEATCTSAAVYFKSCSCGAISNKDADTFTSGSPLPHSHTLETVKDAALKSAATCTSSAVYFKSCSCGAISTNEAETFTSGSVIPHTYDQEIATSATLKTEATCTAAAVYRKSCSCGAVSNVETDVFSSGSANGHSHRETASTPATCEAAPTKTYTCHCGNSYTETVGDALGHDIAGATATEKHLQGCEYVQVYTCQREGCGAEIEKDHVFRHSHVASITKAATCQEDGVKTLTCSCGDVKTEVIPKDATGHAWTKGTVTDGVRTDSCAHCSETKKVTVYEGTKTDATNANDLKDTEIELNNANISLDNGVIDALGDKNVTLSADKLEGADREDLGLSADELAQVGDSPIYNFTMNDGSGNISQFGEDNWVTITLPYTLAEGEDVDSIAIWFINDEGELESIEATYNNGYVTFKTNHFSYYTVTRLTPAQRCELYGHSYTVQHQDGSCTQDGYDLYFCVRCHESHKENEVIADGHNYTEVTTDATCTENGHTVYTCEDCKHSYQTTIPAVGHDWEETAHVDATCAQNGHTDYTCSNCNGTYSVVHPTTPHSMTESVTAPTCESNGYTLHECEDCDYSYTDTLVPATGHSYKATTWTWATDYSSATLTFVCEKDATHTTVVTANVGTTVINGTCSNFVKTVYTAAVTFNGTVYTDEKSVETGTPDHTFSSDWKTDGEKHWHECVCGEKSEVAEHNYQNATVTKQPTCAQDGESTSTCVCGKTHVTAVPATGVHTYENGKCSVCGKPECDHTTLHRESLDVDELGGCCWTIFYDTCDCGEVKILDPEMSDISCDFDYDEEKEYIGEDGNLWMEATGKCPDCGISFLVKATAIEDGCTEYYKYWYTFSINGEEFIFLTAEDSYTYHNYTAREDIDLSEHGCCGGTLTVTKCQDCGEIIDIRDFDVDCNVDLNTEPETEEITDENGIVHYVQGVKCEECGFELTVDNWTDEISVCERTVYMSITIRCGEDIIVQITQSQYEEEHEYEYEYEMKGDNCKDGVIVHVSCDVCGTSFTGKTSSHPNREYNVDITFDEYSDCGTTVNVDRCTLCGEILYVNRTNIMCDLEDISDEKITDENGNIISREITSACKDCGAIFVEKEWIEIVSECEYKECSSIRVSMGEECIFAFATDRTYVSHQYEYEYTMNGESCEDGVSFIGTCQKCGATTRGSHSGHNTEEYIFDLEDHEGCAGTITCYRCAICGKITSLANMDVRCNIDEGTSEEIADENGVKHTVTTATCPDCGLTFVSDSWIDVISVCEYTENIAIRIFKGEECIFDAILYSRNYSNHEFEYIYDMHGETCEDGYEMSACCTKCGKTERWGNYEGHRYEYYSIDLTEYGCCGGFVSGEYCPVCETILSINDLNPKCNFDDENATEEEIVDENGITHTVATLTCLDCGMQITVDGWTVVESVCVSYEYMAITIQKGEETIFEGTASYGNENHQYEYEYLMEGKNCYDGYLITYFCPVCGDSGEQYGHGHMHQTTEVDLSELGLCGGYICEESCVVCGEIFDSHAETHCKWEFVEETEDGYVKESCRSCGAIHLSTVITGEKNENCEFARTYIQIFQLNGEEVYRHEHTEYMVGHEYEDEFILHGTSCEDGVTILRSCKVCGESYENYRTYHETYAVYSLYEPIKGVCDEHIGMEIYSCPCGQEFYVKYNENSFSNYDEETHTHSCENCNFAIVDGYISNVDGCTMNATRVFSVKNGDEVLYSLEKNFVFQAHSFTKVETVTADGKTSYVTTCDKCGQPNSMEIYTAVLEDHNGYFYYDFSFTPEVSGTYAIMGLSDRDTYVTLYLDANGKLQQIAENDDGAGNGQFHLTTTLTAGETYVYRIRFYEQKYNGSIDFTFYQSDSADVQCRHNLREVAFLPATSETCEDGILLCELCTNCGIIDSFRNTSGHYQTQIEYIELGEYGACYGNFCVYACPCGQNHGMDFHSCAHNGTENEFYDEEGRLNYVQTRTCSECGLRYDLSYYIETAEGSCVQTYHYTVSITIGSKLVLNKQYTISKTVHDYRFESAIINNGGTSCDDGATVYFKCATCGQEQTRRSKGHEEFPKAKIELAPLGSVCGGYATVYQCACGQRGYVDLEHDLCENYQTNCKLWIENAAKGTSYTINGEYYLGYEAWVYTCAVTDPAEAACGYKIRMARYWQKDADSCCAYYCETWQFGYNPETDTCAYEITVKTGESCIWHDYVDNSGDSGNVLLECKACGSTYSQTYEYNDKGETVKYQREVTHNPEDGNDKYYLRIEEYSPDPDGGMYRSYRYSKWIYANGEEYWEETRTLRQAYTGPFGESGFEYDSTQTDSDGNVNSDKHAYVYYKGYEFSIYRENVRNDHWERYDYTYSFEEGCMQTCVYTCSYEEKENTWTENICRFYESTTTKEPTCTQDGEYCSQCEVCGWKNDLQIISPTDHNWVYVNENHYYCFSCGLENANGASGNVIFEDLTQQYGNGENYVAGYYDHSGVGFSHYVSLILADDTEVIIPDIKIMELKDVRAFAFSKAEVDAFAAANGYTDYDVRFTFVPYGADGSFDYAITFAESTVPTGTIVGDVSFRETVSSEATKKTFTITPDEYGYWTFMSISNLNAWAELLDENGKVITSSYYDYYGFRLDIELMKNATYTLVIYIDGYHEPEEIAFVFDFTPAKTDNGESDKTENGEVIDPVPEEEGKTESKK